MDKVLPILDKVLPILLNKNNLPLILIFVGLAFIILTFVEITLHPPRIRPTRARKLKGTHANLFATGTVVSLVGFGLFLVETFFFSSPPPNPLPGAQKSTPVPTVSETLAPPIGTFHDDFNTPTLDSTLWQIDAT